MHSLHKGRFNKNLSPELKNPVYLRQDLVRISGMFQDSGTYDALHAFGLYGQVQRIAIDARLVKSANHPISNAQIKEFKEKMNTPEGKLDKNGKPKKYTQGLDSDWVIKNNEPHYGLKEHASIGVNHGFILATTFTPSSVNDTNLLQYCTAFSRHTKQAIEKIFADKGYAGMPNRNFLAENKIADGIMRKNSTTATLAEHEIERNKKIFKVRYIAEQYFGISHLNDRAKRARFTAIAKNKVDCWYRQAAYNISRGFKILKVATL